MNKYKKYNVVFVKICGKPARHSRIETTIASNSAVKSIYKAAEALDINQANYVVSSTALEG